MAFATKATKPINRTNYYFRGKQLAITKQPGRPRFAGPYRNKPPHTGEKYHDDKKIEVATMYAVIRDVDEVAHICGVYPYVIRKWKEELWFNNIVDEVKRGKNEVLDAKITDVLLSAVELISDRILNGEYVYNVKSGEFKRSPLKARDAAYITEVVFNKRQLLRGEATSRTETMAYEDKLKHLKSKFEQLAGKTIEGEVINVDSSPKSSGDQNQVSSVQEEGGHEDPAEFGEMRTAGSEGSEGEGLNDERSGFAQSNQGTSVNAQQISEATSSDGGSGS